MEKMLFIVLSVVAVVQAHSCVPCDKSRCSEPARCPGGLVTDVCGCCPVCAKQQNDTCGGLYGTKGKCDQGLKCIIQPEHGKLLTGQETGVCKLSTSVTSTEPCKELEYEGCDVINDECRCTSKLACTDPYQFSNKLQCTMYLLSVEESKTDCTNVGCVVRFSPKCPDDSELVESIWPVGECCPLPSRCECRAEKCKRQLCRPGHDRVLVRRANGKPGQCCDLYQCKPSQSECTNVRCRDVDTNVTCPLDSVKITDRMSKDGCCELPPKCQCKSSVCPVTKCADNYRQIIVLRGTGRPGSCCDIIECVDATVGVCRVNGREYKHGEEFSPDPCRQCECQDGVTHCSKKQCAAKLPCPENIQWTPPGKCCAECRITLQEPPTTIKPIRWCSMNGESYAQEEAWFSDPCTRCVCKENGPQCTATSCQKNCENPVVRDGECCGFCEEPTYMTIPATLACPSMNGCALSGAECPFGFKSNELGCKLCQCRQKSEVCPSLGSCGLKCPRGLEQDGVGCEICKCKGKTRGCHDMSDCNKECPFGYRSNESGCKRCRCRRCLDITATCDKECKHGRQINKYGCKICKCLPDPGTLNPNSESSRSRPCQDEGTKRDDGESWTTSSGRQCVCRGGVTLCDMIQCPVPHCDRPVVKKGFPCAVCPDSVPYIGDHLKCGSRVEGESWEPDSCTSCVCNAGRVMCTFQTCKPALCDKPVYKEDHCCPICTDELEEEAAASLFCMDISSNNKREHGESWRKDMCTSCVCKNLTISCFSDKCPQVHNCQNPVIKRDQCCPQCLDDESSNTCDLGDRKFTHGEVWASPTDPCTSCSCVHGNTFCRRKICRDLPFCTKVVQKPGECCGTCQQYQCHPNRPEDENPEQEKQDQNIIPIIVGVMATVLILVAVAVIVFYLRQKERSKDSKPVYTKAHIVKHQKPGKQESIVT